MSSTSSLKESQALNRAAQSIAKEKGTKGDVEHEKPKVIDEKVRQSGNITGKVGELICFGTNSS